MNNVATRLNRGMFTSNSGEWETPQFFFDKLNRIFNFTLDPCATKENAKCKCFYTIEDNGLEQSWKGHRVFMNPPYGNDIVHWVKKANDECTDALIIGLLPARVDTVWWHTYCTSHFHTFLKGRLRFSGRGSATFPSAIVIFAGIPRDNRNEGRAL